MEDSQVRGKDIALTFNQQARGRFLQCIVPKNSIGAEIGVHKGDFTHAILNFTEPLELHLIDPWYLFGKEWKWAQSNRSTIDALIGILKTFEAELVKKTIILHIGFDQDILPIFPDQYFDWVYLDTSHQYGQTLCELDLLKRKIKPAGIITGDDWHIDPTYLHHGVCKAVREFVEREPYEIIYASDEDKQWAIRKKSSV